MHRRDRTTVLFATAVFVSAFLLFQIQPLISKAILPWFGGSPGVWTTCMLFFQVALFAGYAYAHVVTSRMPLRVQVLLHLGLIGIALALLKVLPDPAWQPSGSEPPVQRIALLLAATVGLPYFLLATTGPLLQRWFSLVSPGQSPYRLYALSNAGSLLALLSYPFVVEPALVMSSQARLWSVGFWLFALLCAACGWRLFAIGAPGNSSTTQQDNSSEVKSPTARTYLLWFLPAMLASTIYLAATNEVCQDIAVIPFLWVIPLSLYLLSFILCFESDRWYRRRWFALATCGLVIAVCYAIIFGAQLSVLMQVGIYFGAMFCVCMLCHGEVARSRPDARHLTAFYLTLSAGGAGGGLFVALVAPQVFPDFWELHLCLLAAIFYAIAVFFADVRWLRRDARPPMFAGVVAVVLVVIVGTVFVESISNYQQAVAMTRNFYGVLEVEADEYDDAVILRHGRIIHGLQLRSPSERMTPTTYYGHRTGVGRAIDLLKSRKESLRIGLVGLGVGTLAAYGRNQDVMRFYEINDDVIWHARTHFSFLKDSSAKIEIILGDARLSLTNESPQQFDLLVLDAFAGDAIPTHLLTREAFAEYLKHVSDDGIIAVHISNLHFNLRPVTDALADEYGLATVTIIVPEVQKPVDPSSEWVLMSRDPAAFDAVPFHRDVARPQPNRVLWTDSFSNLFQILRD